MGYQFAWDAFDFELMPSYHAPMAPSLLMHGLTDDHELNPLTTETQRHREKQSFVGANPDFIFVDA
jgi:hypothetical protein